MIELTKVQLQASINKPHNEGNRLTSVLEMTLNGMMHSERNIYLENQSNNKENVYHKAFAVGMDKQIELQIPRDRLGMFQPMILALIRDQNQQIENLSFELYGNRLIISQIGEAMHKIYGKHYSKSAISNITADFSSQMSTMSRKTIRSILFSCYIDAIHLKLEEELLVQKLSTL